MQLRSATGVARFAAVALGLVAAASVARAADPPATAPGDRPSNLTARDGSELAAYSDTDGVAVATPGVSASIGNPLSGWNLGGSYLVDIVSAASVDIVSTASEAWTEVRQAGSLDVSYKPHSIGVSLSGSVSSEPDYLSTSGGAALSFELANKQVNPLVGYSYTHDVAGRSDTPFSVYSLPVDRHTINAAVDLVLHRTTELTLTNDLVLESGDQIKPYRYLPVFAGDVAGRVPAGASVAKVNQLRLPGRIGERTPLTRNRFALTARLAWRGSATTLILSERAYTDDWGVKATTTNLRFVIDLGRRFSAWPEARLHVQSGASFWHRAYVGTLGSNGLQLPEYRSGDRELGPLWTGTFGGGARWNIGGEDPRAWSLVGMLEGASTSYSDALFVETRASVLGALDLEARFE